MIFQTPDLSRIGATSVKLMQARVSDVVVLTSLARRARGMRPRLQRWSRSELAEQQRMAFASFLIDRATGASKQDDSLSDLTYRTVSARHVRTKWRF